MFCFYTNKAQRQNISYFQNTNFSLLKKKKGRESVVQKVNLVK